MNNIDYLPKQIVFHKNFGRAFSFDKTQVICVAGRQAKGLKEATTRQAKAQRRDGT